MLFVTDCIQLTPREHYQGNSFKIGGKVIRTVKYAAGLVLLAKEEAVLQGIVDRLTEILRCYGMAKNVDNTKVLSI